MFTLPGKRCDLIPTTLSGTEYDTTEVQYLAMISDFIFLMTSKLKFSSAY